MANVPPLQQWRMTGKMHGCGGRAGVIACHARRQVVLCSGPAPLASSWRSTSEQHNLAASGVVCIFVSIIFIFLMMMIDDTIILKVSNKLRCCR
jgi:hypothetical protein